jgi:hypothetical protein
MLHWSERSERKRHSYCYVMCRLRPRHVPQTVLEQACQLVCGKAGVPKNGPERPLGHVLVIRHRNAAKGGLGVTQYDVAALLTIDHVARPL